MSVQAQASTQAASYVTRVQITGSRYLFFLDGSRTSRPACDCCNRWEVDGSTAAGQSMIATILTALSLHRLTTISGTGSCVPGSNDTEGVALLDMQ